MTDLEILKSNIKNSFKSIDELWEFNEYADLFRTKNPHVWYLPFGEGNFNYVIWEGTKDGGSNQLLCEIDYTGRIVDSKYLGVVYQDEEY